MFVGPFSATVSTADESSQFSVDVLLFSHWDVPLYTILLLLHGLQIAREWLSPRSVLDVEPNFIWFLVMVLDFGGLILS